MHTSWLASSTSITDSIQSYDEVECFRDGYCSPDLMHDEDNESIISRHRII